MKSAVPQLVIATSLGGLLIAFPGCLYSFTGASVPSHLKTVAVPLLDDQSGFGEPNLREKFTTTLIDLFINDNTLEIADRNVADAILEGAILPIKDAPLVVQQGEQVSKNRITMSVKMSFQDMKLRKKVWEKTFTNTGDYDVGGGSGQRDVGLKEAMRKLTEDILLETVSGW